MTALLSLLAAASYGLGDFSGGLFSKRAGAWAVTVVAQVSGTLLILLVVLADGGSPTSADLAWALLAGVGNGLGTAFLYRGLAAGRMGVVAPVSGVGCVVLPALAGVLGGERPTLVVWAGVLLALPAISLVAREPVDSPAAGRSGLADGVLAGLGFGTMFAALGQVPERAGFLPLAVSSATAVVAVVALAICLRAAWVPRDRYAAGGLLPGMLGALATGLFQVASQHGYLTVAAVITSLYPAGTVLLAGTVLRERVHRAQGYGLVLCAAAVVLVAAG